MQGVLIFKAGLHKFWELGHVFGLLADIESEAQDISMTARLLVGAALGLALSNAALAQSYTAPAGIPAATAPGGLEGQAGARNIRAYHNNHSSRLLPGQAGAVDGITTGSVRGTPPRHGR